MANGDFGPALPIAATMDLQYRLPPFQQILFTPTIIISITMLVVALIVVLYLSRRAKSRAKAEHRREALETAERILLKRGGNDDDADRMLAVFSQHPGIDPSAIVMIKERFQQELTPVLVSMFDKRFAERMENLYFPPSHDTRRAIAGQPKDLKSRIEEGKDVDAGQNAAAILDLMDAVLRPGVIARLTFEGLESGYECMVMGHDSQTVNFTLPAYNDKLVAALRPGMKVDGSMESGPSLLAFTSTVIQAVAGSMPYCRISTWKSVWEIHKRDSVRLATSIEIDFQHLSTSQTETIRMSSLDREIGSIRPGRLVDISLGGCCIETPSDGTFRVGDMLRFSKSLLDGTPPATLLGAIVNVGDINPETNEGSRQRLHIQFLIIDDVSQRILVRTLRQLQNMAEKVEWTKAQQLLQQMRRNHVENIGSPPSPAGRREGDMYRPGTGQRHGTGGHGAVKGAGERNTSRTRIVRSPSTRSIPRAPERPRDSKPPPTRRED